MHGSFIYDDADAKREDINSVLLEIVLQKYSILLTVQEGLICFILQCSSFIISSGTEANCDPVEDAWLHGYLGQGI